MNIARPLALAAVTATTALTLFMTTGCEVDSATNINRDIPVNFAGVYRNGGNALTDPVNSGAPITQLNLTQSGDVLEGVDNNGSLWKGNIGNSPDAANPVASFTLTGKTTAGVKVTDNGTLNKTGATSASMTGTWIEPNYYATLSATATVAPSPTNTPINTNTNGSLSNLTIRAALTPAEQLAFEANKKRLWFMPWS